MDCPTCLRKNLGATRRVDGQYLDNMNPNLTYGVVPPHAATASRPEQIPEQHFVGATWERDRETLRAYANRRENGDDTDVYPQDLFR